MEAQDLRRTVRSRLAYLDQCLRWRGHANRSTLTRKFGISPAQAAVDFREYLARCREPLPLYDTVRKTYVASDGHLGLEDAGELPPMLEVIADGAGDRFDALPMPDRQCPAGIMRHLYQAMDRGMRIEIDYVSMTSGRTTSQWIAPARIGSDGERLHLRAWSFRHQEWRDYLPVRVSDASTFAIEPLSAPLPHDQDWETMVRIGLRPRSDLSPDQQQAARDEYGFAGEDIMIIETRAALAFYLDRRWGLNLAGSRLERAEEI
ncbi:hypothetical protein CA235_10780 [Sphingomonas sp. ABOLF]|uniref:WYL domain-containing protein n=1 Tax=Sphingomonas sp. ABOLF TaxID=1985879 RepID=UPI000F7E3D0C|nr:WYL domain-containing protein [Sphingomonas sp. ABOLF]RSV14984.1 hypothetical protein CA235_10780 [Sphingomonas sp. ABOLF]